LPVARVTSAHEGREKIQKNLPRVLAKREQVAKLADVECLPSRSPCGATLVGKHPISAIEAVCDGAERTRFPGILPDRNGTRWPLQRS
jgi:hypothetical protein